MRVLTFILNDITKLDSYLKKITEKKELALVRTLTVHQRQEYKVFLTVHTKR